MGGWREKQMADEASSSQRTYPAHITALRLCAAVCVISGVCPHDIFLNSKFDLRACTNKHDDAAKQQSVTRTRGAAAAACGCTAL